VIDEGEIEARVVRDEHCVARELEEAAHSDAGVRLSTQLRVLQAREGADRRAEWDAGVDQQLELLGELEVAHADRPDLADARAPGPQARRLEIHHDEARVFEQELGARRIGESHRIATPGQPGVVVNDLLQQAAGEPNRRVP